jgi:hypothetical protein
VARDRPLEWLRQRLQLDRMGVHSRSRQMDCGS